jgi:hypothetical protein
MLIRPAHVLAVIAALATAGLAQNSNDTPLSNGFETVVFFSDPSGGSTFSIPGTVGDMFWRAYSGDRMLAHQQGLSGSSTMEIDGFYEELYDTDWSTTPHFYTRMVVPALPVPGAPCALEPDFLQLGFTGATGTTVLMGPSGFGTPCTIAPSLCSPGGCGIGGPIGWITDIGFGPTPGSGVVLPADGTSASDVAVAYFLPDGMPATGGPCGQGDYSLQALYSTDESQADDCGGLNAFSGKKLGTAAAVQDPYNETPVASVAWREPMLNVIADSGPGAETGLNGGGALNGFKLDTQGGAAHIGIEVRDLGGVGGTAFGWWSTAAGGPPGVLHQGAWLLQRFSRDMPACFRGMVAPTVFTFVPEGAFASCQMAVPPVASSYDVFWQAVVYDPALGMFHNTNRVRTTLY